jgi:hypothetical protein
MGGGGNVIPAEVDSASRTLLADRREQVHDAIVQGNATKGCDAEIWPDKVSDSGEVLE